MTFCASKTVNGVTTNHIWDGTNIVAETDGNKQVAAKYYRGSGLISQEVGNTESYYQFNMHGDVIGLMGANGELIEDYDYDAFGNQLSEEETSATPFRYNGEYYDEKTGFTYLRARYYDPSMGRFITEDPIHDGINWYAYCGNNPVVFIDPLGLAPYDHFSSEDEAAADFGLYIGEKSFELEEELAAYIYEGVDQDNKKYYYYDDPRNDLPTHEERKIGFSISWSGIAPYSLVHTHGAYDADNENIKDGFSSPNDVASGNPQNSDSYQSDTSGLDYYVVTPNGNLRKYESNSGNYEGDLINSNMPKDPRIEIHENMKNTLIWNLIKQNYPEATDQDIVNARKNNLDSWIDVLNELERYR